LNDQIINRLKTRLNLNGDVLGKDKYFNSAVLIPIILVNNEFHLLFEKRAKEIRQGGEVSFPGGEFDLKKDKNFLDAALREIFEEIGVSKSDIEILGRLDTLVAPMGVTVDPFVGFMKSVQLNNLKIDESEVEKTFTVPLSYFMQNEPSKYFVRLEVKTFQENKDGTVTELLPVKKLNLPEHYSNPWKGRKHRIFVYENTEEVIWGITAELVYELCRTLK
jgi:8-oxo-dGTP pyrophosphatase MutT (NUDIX family)